LVVLESCRDISNVSVCFQERTTIASRPFASSLQAGFLDKTKEVPIEGKKQLILLVTSDKGLCGALNSTLVRPLQLALRKNAANMAIACIGVKGRNGLTSFKDSIMLHVSDFGKNPVSFLETAYVTDLIFNGPPEERREHDVVRVQYVLFCFCFCFCLFVCLFFLIPYYMFGFVFFSSCALLENSLLFYGSVLIFC
jgi:hypothetical protein